MHQKFWEGWSCPRADKHASQANSMMFQYVPHFSLQTFVVYVYMNMYLYVYVYIYKYTIYVYMHI